MQALKKLYPIPIIALLFLFPGCSRTTFDADVDGVPMNASAAGARYDGGRLDIGYRRYEPDTAGILIEINAKGPGTFVFNDDDPKTGNGAAYFPCAHSDNSNDTVFATNSHATGTVTISGLDIEEKTVSGSFQFQASQIAPHGSKVVNIKGSFENVPLE
ncbi:MAG TPA: DUF6252 family protein [Candidatus Acidoferrales bacterium]|nr:DUF6252 family protein [Candidatus Acidoferrales bacterium]